jgi:hypothetical protein
MNSRFANLSPELEKLWNEKFEFNRDTLGVETRESAEAADRTIEIALELEKEQCV